MQNRLYIGNLAEDVAASTLQDLFEPHGFVMDVRLSTGGKGSQAPGSAVVTMAKDESAKAAIIALNGASLHGLVISVVVALDHEPLLRIGSKGVA